MYQSGLSSRVSKEDFWTRIWCQGVSFIEVSVRMFPNFSVFYSDHCPMKPVEIMTLLWLVLFAWFMSTFRKVQVSFFLQTTSTRKPSTISAIRSHHSTTLERIQGRQQQKFEISMANKSLVSFPETANLPEDTGKLSSLQMKDHSRRYSRKPRKDFKAFLLPIISTANEIAWHYSNDLSALWPKSAAAKAWETLYQTQL